MQKDPGIEHDERYMAHVEPGETEIIVWQFTRTGGFLFRVPHLRAVRYGGDRSHLGGAGMSTEAREWT